VLKSSVLRFPDGFFWGAATAAHQIEGHNVASDWWAAEQAGRMPFQSGAACDSWTRWPEDIALLRAVGLNSYRLSLEWARLEPTPGQFDPVAIATYRAQLEALRAAGIEPLVTLHHFTNPQWLAERGGWRNPAVVDHLTAYADRAAREFGDLVRWWITLNEPSILGYKTYLEGTWPPHHRGDVRGYLRLMRHAGRAHPRMRQALRAQRPDAQVGLAFALWPMQPLRAWSPIDQLMAHLGDYYWQARVLHRTAATLDWIGVNFYSRTLVGWPWPAATAGAPGPRTDFGWEIYPVGLYETLRRVGRLGRPVIVTENGISNRADDLRAAYIVDHVRAMYRAIRAGVDLRGYQYWTLLDNFEWADGFEQAFGLATQARELRPSAQLYGAIARANGLDDALWRAA
jgi:beta-glucosidase